MATQITVPGPKGFLLWMQANQPKLYAAVKAKLSSSDTLSGMGSLDPITSATTSPASSSFLDSMKNLFTGAAQIYLSKQQIDVQKKIIDTQLQRAAAGQPPLNIDPLQYGLQPTLGVGLSPDTKKLLMWGGGGLGLLMLIGIINPFGRRR